MQTAIKLQSLQFNNVKTYLAAAVFIVGNLAMPQLLHLVPQGGATWLPIYFFTLVGAYIYGWRVGLITALVSPLANSLLFGMPAVAMLPIILIKSTLLALISGCVAQRFRAVTVGLLLAVVLAYQVVGTFGEWALCGDFRTACQDFRLGIPGMLFQIFAGYLVIKTLTRR